MSQPPGKIRVLVVDDEEDMCWALRQIIEAGGHACSLARTAQEALRCVDTESFDLAFVDVKLPDMNGFDLVRCMHRLAADLPCVLVSGFLYYDDDQVQDGLASGLISGFIGKPFLLRQMEEVLAGVAAAGRDAELRSADTSGKPIPLDGIGVPRPAVAAPPGETVPAETESPNVMAPWQLGK